MNIKDRAEAKEYVLKAAKEQDVKFIRMWFTDILGFLKSFAITFFVVLFSYYLTE